MKYHFVVTSEDKLLVGTPPSPELPTPRSKHPALQDGYDDGVPELIGQRCTELERGARMVDAMITNTMLPEIGREFLSRLVAGQEIKRVHVAAKDRNFAFAFD